MNTNTKSNTVAKVTGEERDFINLAKEKKVKIKYTAKNSKKLSLDEKLAVTKIYL